MSDRTRVFVVARNPHADSKLPYLLLLPLVGGLVLKARESWPATARVYCYRFEQALPEDAEIFEQTAVLRCRRRGAAKDLVLDRPRLSRSQFVFTQVKGREAIFWQTQKTARAANPGVRIPRRRTLTEPFTIAVDTRERCPYRFPQQRAETVHAAVPAGDYAVHAPDGNVLAAVERKSLENLAATLSDGTLAFQLQRLAEVPLAATPAASPKTGPTASSRQRSPTRPTRTRTAETPRPGRPVPAICPELERIGVFDPYRHRAPRLSWVFQI
jgi:hypothetical protein